MINLPNISLKLPNKPYNEFKLATLDENSEEYRSYTKMTQTLKYIGDQKIGTFKWPENDTIPDEGKKLKI